MKCSDPSARRLGIATVGLGGAVATTMAGGLELMRAGQAGLQGLPLATLDDTLTQGLVAYENLVVAGWDFVGDDLATSAEKHGVLSKEQLEQVRPALTGIRPWPAVADTRFCREVSGNHVIAASSLQEAVDTIGADLRRFREEEGLDGIVMLNLASTERRADPEAPALKSAEAFAEGLATDDEAISPAMLYAWAAIEEGVPYVNFTPSPAADVPAVAERAAERGVPIAGKDGKTGQTFLKTVVAPGLRDRALKVEGWFSTNILGNRDGVTLKDEEALNSKLDTKGSVLDQILGYTVEDHVVDISYYRPRGDNKEAWDNVDLVGFLGQKMQLKINFLCRDSILAAPLAIELARLMDLAERTGESGVQEQLGVFFKSPMTRNGAAPEHALPEQQRALLRWLKAHQAAPSSSNTPPGRNSASDSSPNGASDNGTSQEVAASEGR